MATMLEKSRRGFWIILILIIGGVYIHKRIKKETERKESSALVFEEVIKANYPRLKIEEFMSHPIKSNDRLHITLIHTTDSLITKEEIINFLELEKDKLFDKFTILDSAKIINNIFYVSINKTSMKQIDKIEMILYKSGDIKYLN
jgi:hypothetical protein